MPVWLVQVDRRRHVQIVCRSRRAHKQPRWRGWRLRGVQCWVFSPKRDFLFDGVRPVHESITRCQLWLERHHRDAQFDRGVLAPFGSDK